MYSVLITGGCGFIGRHFAKKMTDLKYNVTIVDNLSSTSSLIPDKWPKHLICDFDFIECDILDYLNHTNKKFNLIIHTAAIVGGREIIENDPLLISKNINIDNELFRWIERNSCDNLIYFSSSAAYPIRLQTFETHRKLELSDIDIINDNISIPDLTYGWTKLTGEFMLSILSKRINTNISIYRPFSGYGEDQHDSYPFTSIIKKILNNSDEIEIWSDAVRDFVYIDDIIEFVLNTCYHTNKIKVFNIGTGIATSMSELAHIILQQTNKEKKIKILDNKPKGVYYRVCLDNTNFIWTKLESGIKKILEYYKLE
jgi:GDP-L-fucose synthase